MTERLALLSAILAAPDDDLPRLVFADWLEEHGTTDADAARVEFIRLGCKGKAKTRMTLAEGKWLDANWKRLLVHTLAAWPKNAKPPTMNRQGRIVILEGRWAVDGSILETRMVFEYVRGFARRIEYLQSLAYQRYWQPAAIDEPLAYHRPETRPSLVGNRMSGWYARLLPTTWGGEVFARAPGSTEPSGREKLYHAVYSTSTDSIDFHQIAFADEDGLGLAECRWRAAVATAMTAIAREYVGLAEPTPGG